MTEPISSQEEAAEKSQSQHGRGRKFAKEADVTGEFEVTERLHLLPATLAHIEAELESNRAIGRMLRADIPEGWPPGDYDRGAIHYFRERFRADTSLTGWLVWYGILLQGRRRIAVGAAGFFGPPNDEGEVEIGYSVVSKFRRRGVAGELVAGLIQRLAQFPEVRRVIAHTHPDNKASVRVLERLGFRYEGEGQAPDSIRYARSL